MTDPLEQRLRDALEAYAQSVTPENIDHSREQEVVEITAASHATARRSRWAWRLSVVGLAAAGLVVGSLALGNLTDSSSPPSPQADLLPSASTSQKATTEGTGAPQSTAPASPTAGSTPSAPAVPPPSPQSPEASTPAERTSDEPAPSPEEPRPTSDPPIDEDPQASPSSPTTEPAPPRTRAMTSPTDRAGSLQVTVDAAPAAGTQSQWSVTASGTASSRSPSGGVLRYTVDHGDGTVQEHTVRGGCDDAAPVRPVTFSTGQQQHEYQQPGTFRVSVRVEYCARADQVAVGTGASTVAIP